MWSLQEGDTQGRSCPGIQRIHEQPQWHLSTPGTGCPQDFPMGRRTLIWILIKGWKIENWTIPWPKMGPSEREKVDHILCAKKSSLRQVTQACKASVNWDFAGLLLLKKCSPDGFFLFLTSGGPPPHFAPFLLSSHIIVAVTPYAFIHSTSTAYDEQHSLPSVALGATDAQPPLPS